jgi:hypothetical protein
MFIYANGDSFTRGSELANYLLPDFPGNTALPATNLQRLQNQKWITRVHKARHELVEHTLREEVKLAYPQKVADILGCECYNNAHGGSSIDRIARTTITDLARLKNEKKDIVALIGTTNIYRIEMPTPNQAWDCGQPTRSNNHVNKDITDYYIKYYTEYHAKTTYYKNLIFIRDFCKLNQIRLVLIDASHQPELMSTPETGDLKTLKDYLDLKYDFDISKIAYEMGGDIFCPLGHFTEPVHNKLAEEIAKTL